MVNCQGRCRKHNEPCVASLNPSDIAFMKRNAKVLGTKSPRIKNGVLQHTHRCRKCLEEARERDA